METRKRTAIVTGASSGIGMALAKELHSRGLDVYVGARRVDRMQELANLGIHVFKLDVTSDDSVAAFKLEVEKLCNGKIDFLFNNAGQVCLSPAAEVCIEDSKQCFDVNFHGVLRMVKAFVGMIIAAKGKIIQTGSVSGDLPFPWGSVYAATKAALKSYSDILRLELAPFDVDVVCVVAGGVTTDIADNHSIASGSRFVDARDSFAVTKAVPSNIDPMPADEFAKKVLDQVDVKHAPEHIWLGGSATMYYYARNYLPRWLTLKVLKHKFLLYKYNDKVRARAAKKAD